MLIRLSPRAADHSAAAHLRSWVLLTASICRGNFPKNCMAESTYLPGLALQNSGVLDSLRHSVLVRVTRWNHTLSFFAHVVSSIPVSIGAKLAASALLLFSIYHFFFIARTYLVGADPYTSLSVDMSLKQLFYAVSGLLSQHFLKNLLPARVTLSWSSIARVVSDHLHLKRPTEKESLTYNSSSDSLTSLWFSCYRFDYPHWPRYVSGHNLRGPYIGDHLRWPAIRTIHFFIANLLVLFLLVHIATVKFTETHRTKSQPSKLGLRISSVWPVPDNWA